MSNYKDYNGSALDYDRDTGLLDNGRSERRKYQQYPSWALSDDYDGDYEHDMVDPDLDWD